MFHQNGPTFFELARQAFSSTERGYDLLAPKFNFTPFRTPDLVLDRVVEQVKSLGPFDDALDVCCGTGAGMTALMPHCEKRMVGIDFSRGMLDVAQKEVDQQNHGDRLQLQWIHADIKQMAFQSEFDLITCFGAFGHVLPRDEPQFVHQIAQALKPGGIFAFVTSEMPSKLTATYWLARGINASMHVRNLLIRPHFIMFYLTFLWPDVGRLLREQGLIVKVSDLFPDRPRMRIHKLVIAERPHEKPASSLDP